MTIVHVRNMYHILLKVLEISLLWFCRQAKHLVFSDGSEARKTGMEKELIFVRVICGWITIYFCSALKDCNEFGGTNADSLKLAVDTAFDKHNGLVKLPDNTYKYRMISSTADGASADLTQ